MTNYVMQTKTLKNSLENKEQQLDEVLKSLKEQTSPKNRGIRDSLRK